MVSKQDPLLWHQAPDLAAKAIELEIAFADDLARMEETLTAVIAVARDGEFQELVRPGKTEGPFAVGLSGDRAWLIVDGQTDGALTVEVPAGLSRISLRDCVASDPAVAAKLREAAGRTGAATTAQALVRDYFTPATIPDRATAESLLHWSPAVDIIAYSAASRVAGMIEIMRPGLLGRSGAAGPRDRVARRRYWVFTTMLARALTLGTASTPVGWLEEMEANLSLRDWTPSRWLIRERSGWLAAIGAKAAASFGPTAAGRYARRLQASRHPVDVLDALIGLTSIGLAHPGSTAEIADHVAQFQARPPAPGLLVPGFAKAAADQAAAILRDPDFAVSDATRYFGSRRDSRSPLGIAGLLSLDPTDADSALRILGLSLVPLVISQPREMLLPRIRPRRGTWGGLSDREIDRLFNRTWVGATPSETLQ